MAKGKQFAAVVFVQVAVGIPITAASFEAALEQAKAIKFSDAVAIVDGNDIRDSTVELQAVEKPDVWIRY